MRILLKSGTLLDANHGGQTADILVEDSVITAVEPHLDANAEQIIDLAGYTVLPGFVDAHVHVVVKDGPFDDRALRGWARNGVAAVRECAILGTQSAEALCRWLRETDSVWRPHVVTTGKFIDVAGGYGSELPAGRVIGLLIETPEDAVQAVRRLHDAGCGAVKLPHDTSPSPDGVRRNGMDASHVAAICRTAKELGMPVTCHISESASLALLVENGISDAGHTPGDVMPQVLIEAMVEKGIPMVTTMRDLPQEWQASPFDDMPGPMPSMSGPMPLMGGPGTPGGPKGPGASSERDLRQQAKQAVMLENMKRFLAAGGQAVIGTDYMRSKDPLEHAAIPFRELAALCEAGLTIQQAIIAGTLNGAKALRLDALLGTLEVGKEADIVAVPGALDETFEALRTPAFVMNRGEILRMV